MEDIKINEIEVTKLDPKATYVCQVNLGDMPKETILSFCTRLKAKLESVGIKNIVIVPYNESYGKLEFVQTEGE